MKSLALVSAGTLLVLGCSADSPTTGPSLKVQVSPLSLPRVTDACFALSVTNGPGGSGDTVWTQDALCSSSYGDGRGALSYIGPCDASTGVNSVSLVVTDLSDDDGPVAFVNPCPDDHPCVLDTPCAENADTPVTFNLTIMRPASQGFFDIAVNFDDVFCSAKLDCEYAPGEPIALLHDPVTGERRQTAVLAFACTGGPGDVATTLYANSVRVSCADPTRDGWYLTTALDPTQGPGQAFSANNPDPDPSDAVWQYATYFGREQLDCGTDANGDPVPCNKLYWNMAIGYDPGTPNCEVLAEMTASKRAFAGFATPEDATYPYITVKASLTDGAGSVCHQNPLFGDGSDVAIGYTAPKSPVSFCHSFDGDLASTDPACLPGASDAIKAQCGFDSPGENGCHCEWGDTKVTCWREVKEDYIFPVYAD